MWKSIHVELLNILFDEILHQKKCWKDVNQKQIEEKKKMTWHQEKENGCNVNKVCCPIYRQQPWNLKWGRN